MRTFPKVMDFENAEDTDSKDFWMSEKKEVGEKKLTFTDYLYLQKAPMP